MKTTSDKNLSSYYERFIEEFEKIRPLSPQEKARLKHLAEEGPFMDLRSDWAFKHIMADTDILKKLLNDILPVSIDEVTPLPNEVDRFFAGDKDVTMDVLCKSADESRQFIVEIQRSKEAWFTERMLYYGASMFHSQIKAGDNYDILCPVFVICFMDFELPHGDDRAIYRYALRETSTGERYPVLSRPEDDLLMINLCELPRLQKRPESLNPEEKWLYILKNMHNFAEKPQDIDETFDRVFELSRLSGLQDKEKFQYFRDMLSDFQKKNIGTAYYNDGLKAGMERGRAEGRAENAHDIARKMLSAGSDPAFIKEMTGVDLS